MRSMFLFMLALAVWPAQGETIAEVLQRSQQMRLAAMPVAPADGPAARAVRKSFDALRKVIRFDPQIELRVIRGPVIAETLDGHVVVANESLAELPESARRFILAHELGHVMLGHWAQMGLVFQKWVPGAVAPQQTEPVAALLGHDASGLAHRQEFEADAFAARTVLALGASPHDVLAVFTDLGAYGASDTHPSVRERIAALRVLDLQPATRNRATEPVRRPD